MNDSFFDVLYLTQWHFDCGRFWRRVAESLSMLYFPSSLTWRIPQCRPCYWEILLLASTSQCSSGSRSRSGHYGARLMTLQYNTPSAAFWDLYAHVQHFEVHLELSPVFRASQRQQEIVKFRHCSNKSDFIKPQEEAQEKSASWCFWMCV